MQNVFLTKGYSEHLSLILVHPHFHTIPLEQTHRHPLTGTLLMIYTQKTNLPAATEPKMSSVLIEIFTLSKAAATL